MTIEKLVANKATGNWPKRYVYEVVAQGQRRDGTLTEVTVGRATKTGKFRFNYVGSGEANRLEVEQQVKQLLTKEAK